MAAAHHLRSLGMPSHPLTRHLHATTRTIAVAVIAVLFLSGCGGTPAKPTADDTATIAAARTATGVGMGTTTGTGTTAGTPGATTASSNLGAARGFGGLLTPVRSTATTTGARGTGTSTATGRGAGTAASSATTSGRVLGTPGGSASAASPSLDPCVLLTPAEVSKAMTEPFSQFDNQEESPAGMTSRFRGYSSASCTFAATGSTQDSVRAVQLGTIRRTPASNPPTGTGALGTIGDVWGYIKQQESASNPSVLMGIGDEAFVLSDPDNPGDEDVFVRKGEIVLLVTVTGYDMGARDKAVAVATQAVKKL